MIYFLDGNQEVIKIVRSEVVISAIQTQELPEDNSLLRDYLSVRLKNDERLFNAQYMAIKSHGGNRNAFDLYRIASELVPDNATEFMGVQVAPYELEGVVIEDLRPQNRPLNQTMNQVLEGSDWRIGYVADNLPNVTTNFYYTSVKDALKKIQELTNVEMLFKVEISGNKITDKWVEVYHQLGNRTMKRFNYGTNALSVVRESSHDELYTALIGRGKGEEVGETESGDATYGRKIDFADVEWKKSAGKPVDKPRGQKYIELPNATAEYGIKLIDGRKVPRIGIVEFNDTDDPEKLIQQTYQELLVRARPKMLFKASVINTGDMLIGDTVTIHRHDLDFHYQARVRKVVRDRKNNNKTQVEIGDVVHTPSTKRQGQINSALNNVASDLENVRGELTEARSSADGKNTNFYGNVEPDRKKVGDTWFRDHPSLTGESQILVWNGEAWELIMDTSDTTKVAREVEQAMEEAEEAKQQAVASKQEAIDEAGRLVTEQDTIYQELFDGYDTAVSDLTEGIGVADQKAADALIKAGEGVSLAQSATDGVERVERNLTTVSNKTDDAFSKADNALTKANNIPSTIDDVITDKGLVSGDWVTTKINDETGEINYALESVKGDVPDVIMGVVWDKEESPILNRTDYVEEFTNLDDYELQSAEFRLSVDGLGMDLAEVKRDKLDSGVFTSFKTNEYTNDIDGIRQRLTSAEENKLDDSTFQSFKEHDYQVTVDGLSGNIEKLEREKLDGDEFTNFKSNEYQLTVEGFELALTDISGAVPNLVLGVEWNRTESPRMERTDYTGELDLTNYDLPDYVMGVEWDKKENPLMVRTYDTQESTSKEEFELFLADYSFRADGWDATNSYITENSTAINSLMSNAQGWSQTISYVDENQTKFNDTVSQVDFYKQTIGSDAENLAQLVMTDEAFVTRIGELEGKAEDIILGVEWERDSSPTMARTGYMDDWTETQVAQLADSWSMNLKSNGDVVTAINATEEGVRILGRNIILDGDTLVTGNFAVSGDHVILDADTQVRGDFTVSGSNVILNAQTTVMGDFKVLGKNIILDGDTTIHGDFSVFGKNIILDGDTTVQGTFKVTDTMIAANAEIDGAKIADATIGSAKIASLDVGKISGETSNFVQSAWNSINSRADMDANRLMFTHADGSSTQIGVNGLERVESGTTRPYQYRTYVGSMSSKGDTLYGLTTIKLPPDFIGKDFNVIISFRGYRRDTSSNDLYELMGVYIGEPIIDKVKGEFRFDSYLTTYKYTYATVDTEFHGAAIIQKLDFSNLFGKGFLIDLSYVATY